VPTRLAALLVSANEIAPDGPAWTLLGWDGDVPDEYVRPGRQIALPPFLNDIPGTTVLQFECAPTLRIAICIGPRLDGTSLGGVDIETIRMLGRSVLPSFEASLLREHTRAEDQFRRGLFALSHELAAVGAADDALRVTAHYAATLMGADIATVLRRETPEGQAYVPLDDLPELPGYEDLDTVIRLDLTALDEMVASSQSGHVSFVNKPGQHSVLVCWLGEQAAAQALLVLVRDAPFVSEDARRAVEIADHAVGALRRVQVSAHAVAAGAYAA